MRAAAAFVLLVLLLLGFILIASAWNHDSAADYVRAEAAAESMVIRAQSQAAAITMLAAVLWGVLLVLGVLGIGIVALAFAAVVNRPKIIQPPPQLIERRVMYLPTPGQSRREVWQAIADSKTNVKVIPGKVVKK